MKRDEIVLNLRPAIAGLTVDNSTESEIFQNLVLRPLLKFQNNVLVLRFLRDSHTIKFNFAEKNGKEQATFIDQKLKSDLRFQREIIGIINGLLTEEEWEFYLKNRSETDRRILTMTAERLKDQCANNANNETPFYPEKKEFS